MERIVQIVLVRLRCRSSVIPDGDLLTASLTSRNSVNDARWESHCLLRIVDTHAAINTKQEYLSTYATTEYGLEYRDRFFVSLERSTKGRYARSKKLRTGTFVEVGHWTQDWTLDSVVDDVTCAS